jgi:hypothetical protein
MYFSSCRTASSCRLGYSSIHPKDVTWQVNHLTRDALRIIWHQRLGHMHSRRVNEIHKYGISVPNLPIATEIDDCPIRLKAKLHKAKKNTYSTRKATQCNQGIYIDFGFVVQSSKDSERVRSFSGFLGETCYVLLRNRSSISWRNVLRTPA